MKASEIRYRLENLLRNFKFKSIGQPQVFAEKLQRFCAFILDRQYRYSWKAYCDNFFSPFFKI